LDRVRERALGEREVPGGLGEPRDLGQRVGTLVSVGLAHLGSRERALERRVRLLSASLARQSARLAEHGLGAIHRTTTHAPPPRSFMAYPATSVMPRLSSRGIGNSSTRLAIRAPHSATGQLSTPSSAR